MNPNHVPTKLAREENAIVHLRRRFWIESALGILTAVLAVVTIIWPAWIELVFNIEPDAGNGSIEIAITLGAAIASVVFALRARIDWRARMAPAAR